MKAVDVLTDFNAVLHDLTSEGVTLPRRTTDRLQRVGAYLGARTIQETLEAVT